MFAITRHAHKGNAADLMATFFLTGKQMDPLSQKTTFHFSGIHILLSPAIFDYSF